MRRRTRFFGGTVIVLVGVLALGQGVLASTRADTVTAPRFEVDPLWPKPLPNHWVLGSVIGVGVDSKDHVFIIHRGDSTLNQRTEVGADATPPSGECFAASIERARRMAVGQERHRGRRVRLPAVRVIGRQLRAALPRHLARRLPARMRKLNGNRHRRPAADTLDRLSDRLFCFVRPEPDVGVRNASLGKHGRGFNSQQGRARERERTKVNEMPIRHSSVDG